LDLYQEYEPSLNSGKCSQKNIYEKISEKLAEKDISFSPKQCMTKLTTMKRMYKKIKDHNSKSGNNRQSWQYYEVNLLLLLLFYFIYFIINEFIKYYLCY